MCEPNGRLRRMVTIALLSIVALISIGHGQGACGEPELAQFRGPADGIADEGWKHYAVEEGVTLERRQPKGSAFYEHRAQVVVALSPEQVLDEIWRSIRDGDMDSLKKRQILRDSPSELLVYDQIRTPIVSDRDYTIWMRRSFDPASRRGEIRCETANDLGPALPKDLVRVPIVRGGWVVEPNPAGTKITYYAFSEPGGRIAAFLARRAQAKRSMADVRHMLGRLLRLPSRK